MRLGERAGVRLGESPEDETGSAARRSRQRVSVTFASFGSPWLQPRIGTRWKPSIRVRSS